MIVDNADDTNVFFNGKSNELEQDLNSLAGFIPQSSNGRILFTSRYLQLACRLTGRATDVFEVKTMDPDKAVQLFRNKAVSKVQAGDEEVKELTQLLEYFPLAIAQAAGYISQGYLRKTLSKYINKLNAGHSPARKLLEEKIGDFRADRTSSIITTWHISFEKISKTRPSAARLLSLMCLCDRQVIPESLLKGNYTEDSRTSHDEVSAATEDDKLTDSTDNNWGWETERQVEHTTPPHFEEIGSDSTRFEGQEDDMTEADINFEEQGDDYQEGTSEFEEEKYESDQTEDEEETEEFDKDIGMLHGYSLVTINENGKDFEMHRLVQVATKRWLKNHEAFEDWLTIFIQSMEAACHLALQNLEYIFLKSLLPHVDKLLESRPLRGDDLFTWATALCQASSVQSWFGHDRESENVLRIALEIMQEYKGEHHPWSVEIIKLLAFALIEQQRFHEAETILSDVLSQESELKSHSHATVLRTLADLNVQRYRNASSENQDQKWLKKAEEAALSALGRVPEISVADYASKTAFWIKECLGRVYLEQGRLQEAEDLFLTCTDALEKEHGSDPIQNSIANRKLAVVYFKQGRFEAALRLNLQALEIARLRLGPEHELTLGTMFNVVISQWWLNQLAEVIALMEECVLGSEETLGHNHPRTLKRTRFLEEIQE